MTPPYMQTFLLGEKVTWSCVLSLVLVPVPDSLLSLAWVCDRDPSYRSDGMVSVSRAQRRFFLHRSLAPLPWP